MAQTRLEQLVEQAREHAGLRGLKLEDVLADAIEDKLNAGRYAYERAHSDRMIGQDED